MKSKVSYAMLALFAAALWVNAALAQPRERKMPFGEGERWSEALDLNDGQKSQMRQIMLDTRKRNIETEARLKVARLELHELMQEDDPDQKKIDAKITEVSKLRETMMRAHVESRLAVQKLLTPEQRKRMQELRPFERFHHGRGHFGGSERGQRERGGHHFGGEDLESPEEL